MTARYRATQQVYPTSEQYLFEGMIAWVGSLKSSIASLTLNMNPDTRAAFHQVTQNATDPEEMLLRVETFLGGYPQNHGAMASFLSGLAHLGGQGFSIACDANDQMCPASPTLANSPLAMTFQLVAVLSSINEWLETLFQHLNFTPNKKFVCSKAVLDASKTFYSNVGGRFPYNNINDKKEHTPEAVIKYIKAQMQAGKSWDAIRPFISTMYRYMPFLSVTWPTNWLNPISLKNGPMISWNLPTRHLMSLRKAPLTKRALPFGLRSVWGCS